MIETLAVLDDPAPATVPEDFTEFLRALGGPTLIRLTGTDRGPPRAVTTLLHGNEPSGARALHRWLRAGRRPRCDALCFVVAIEAALHETPFTHRYLPGVRDLNRCFGPPFDDAPGRLAARLLELLQGAAPACLVDIHNTSGPSPAFAIAVREDPAHAALAAGFCRHLVITDLRLGSLMEISGSPCPAVTVECGARHEPHADHVAAAGLAHYLLGDAVLEPAPEGVTLELYHHPVRLEFAPGTRLAWGTGAAAEADLTLRTDLAGFNFRPVAASVPLGWLGARGLAPLRVRNGRGEDVLPAYFRARAGRLFTARTLKFFMVTSSPRMALDDCLLYAAAEAEHTRARP